MFIYYRKKRFDWNIFLINFLILIIIYWLRLPLR